MKLLVLIGRLESDNSLEFPSQYGWASPRRSWRGRAGSDSTSGDCPIAETPVTKRPDNAQLLPASRSAEGWTPEEEIPIT